VGHIEQPKYSGDFQEKVDNVISACRYFILLINIDTFEREEVIREVKKAYSNGKTQRPKLVVFRQDIGERNSQELLDQTGIDISTENQHDFKSEEELATKVIILCKSKDLVKKEVELTPQAARSRQSEVAGMEQNKSEDKARVDEFKRKIAKCKLWKYFEIKGLLYRRLYGKFSLCISSYSASNRRVLWT
jgi:hypothetical protein